MEGCLASEGEWSVNGWRVSLRPVCDEDLPFLFAIYSSTRTEEMAVVPWSEDEKRSFLRMQFQAQYQYYQQNYAEREFLMIELNGGTAGRLYLDWRPDELRVVDITLLPEYRGHGIGSQLLQRVFREAERRKTPVRIHVEHFNPALRLYRRLGFRVVGDTGIYLLMEWNSSSDGSGEENGHA